ncbi:hypothetical protein FZ103_08705 [Streptomonospora sp. PA3]|uniref:hypothetical protein n=1 Tax=Streptomonospora sp. PA3 TaxID=2607326 RepID=UPI0012DCA136|nr:hypothetical protein [Streptomonospora sp. PA3]MUL41257.1 hypothetical protein [Streptomonospora sp. PA3]
MVFVIGYCVAVCVAAGALLGTFFVPAVYGTRGAPPLVEYLWIPGVLFGGIFGLLLGVVLGAFARDMNAHLADELHRHPSRLLAARRALQRGELTDDAEANRIAATWARQVRRIPHPPRLFRCIFLGMAGLDALCFVFAVGDDRVAGMVLFGWGVLFFSVMGTVGVAAATRSRRRAERVAALQAADDWCSRAGERLPGTTPAGPAVLDPHEASNGAYPSLKEWS